MAAAENDGRQAWIVASLLALQAVLLGYSATRHSPVHLEPAFLASGISHWTFARFELYRANPPLPRMISALPVLLAGCETDWTNYFDGPGTRPEYPCGDDFIKANGPRSLWLFTLARLAGIPINLLAAYLAYRWSRELFGWRGSLLTLTLFVIDPNLLAYGEFATPDAAFTAFGILASYTFWRWIRHPTWTMTVIAGAALGLAELTKLSWLILYGLWPLLWAVWRLWPGERSTGPQAGAVENPRQAPGVLQLSGMLLISLYVINLAYVFDGFGTRLRDFEFVSTTLTGLPKPGLPGNRFRDTWTGSMPVPLPKQYVLGIDTQGKDLQDYPGKSYLRGEWRDGGWWYYYLYGFLVKEPVSFLVLLGLALLTSLKSVSRDEIILLTPAIALLAVTSCGLEFNIHWRYVLPVVGFGCIWLGRVARTWTSPVATAGIASLVLMSMVSLASIYPQHLTHFNALAGGPRYGHQHLLGSSLDWGQDLLDLSKVLRRPEFGNRRVLVVVPERGSPESLDLFPSHVRIVNSVNEARLPRDVLILRSRYLPPTVESRPGPIDASQFHVTWSVHFQESSRDEPPP